MATLYGLDRGFYGYVSDNGVTYQVAITNNDAAAGGFGTVVVGANPPLPRGWRMRKQYGVNATYGRTSIPVADPGLSQWTTPTTFSKHGQAFTPEGTIGERRTTKS